MSVESRKAQIRATYVAAGILIALAVLLSLATPRVAARSPEWVKLVAVERITFYGPHYVAGALTASGIRYAPDDDVIALGPDLLASVRTHYGHLASELGQPLFWGRTRQGRLVYQGIAGAFPVATGWRSAVWWGYQVRLCAATAGGGELCQELRVADTGQAGLQVDLPDATWQRWGWPAERGVFSGRLEVLE